jgi:hypothetical protein
MAKHWSNIEAVAREICTRLYGRHGAKDPAMDADVQRHWHVVAAQLEAGLIDEAGVQIAPFDLNREIEAYRDWRARHPEYVVPPVPRSVAG